MLYCSFKLQKVIILLKHVNASLALIVHAFNHYLKVRTCLLHVPDADDVRPVLESFGEEWVRNSQNDRRPTAQHNTTHKHNIRLTETQ